jgi:filamentous hemagglutinin family protein
MKPKFWLSFLTLTSVVATTQTAQAQTYQPTNRIPVADKTLDTQVSGNGSNFDIKGGLSTGQTLFHSFTDFSIPTNGQANFINPVGNRDIITRVTGNLFSDINGVLNTNGANFLLINPNGVVFGNNAQLKVGKALIGSTANSIDLVDAAGKTFNFGVNGAGDAALLTVNANVLFNPNKLTISSIPVTRGIENYGTLETPNDNQYIGLIGGNVTLNGGSIVAPGGRVDLGGLNSAGTIAINNQGLGFAGNNLTRSDVSLLNGAQVNVAANQVLGTVNTFTSDVSNLGSRININANNVQIINDKSTSNTALSGLSAGLNQNSGIKTTATGGINLDATGQVTLNNGAIYNTINPGATGQIGDINIAANSINITNGSQIWARGDGSGNSGNINIKAIQDIAISGTEDRTLLQGNITGDLSAIYASNSGRGDAGKITIDTPGNLIVTNRGGISSYIGDTGVGNTQGIRINVGNLSLKNLSNIGSIIYTGTGNAGNIDIKTTGDLTIVGTDNRSLFQVKPDSLSAILTLNRGQGDAGKVTIDTNGSVSIANRGGILSSIGNLGVGNSQGIGITASNIKIGNFSNVLADNNGTGNAGNIDIKNTGDLTVSGTDDRSKIQGNEMSSFSSISSIIKGKGSTGKISIDTKGNLSLDNVSVISSSVTDTGAGNSQGVNIAAKNINLSNLSDIGTSTYGGTGNAGNIDIKATGNLTLSGSDNPDFVQKASMPLTQISSFTNGKGDAGKITIDVQGNLSISNRAGVFATILSRGDGNSLGIKINASNVNLSNISAIESISFTGGKGNTGNIDITSKGDVNLTGNSRISSSNESQGEAANISVAGDRVRLNNSFISAEAAGTKGGNIQLTLNDQLLLRNTSKVSTTSGSIDRNGNGGNITINSPLIIAAPGTNNISANAFAGNGGKVNITSQGLFGIQYRQIGLDTANNITSSSTFGQSGAVNISTPGADPGKDSTELPNVTTDASTQISQVCSASNRQNKLTVTGRGGLPPNANDPLTSDVVWQDARAGGGQPVTSSATTNPAKLLPPAVGWVFDGTGKVTLVAATTQGQSTGTSVVCPTATK